jgi:ABC-type multidrug transport system ATPase subunit
MAEANELCDRVAILDSGRLLACDSPSALGDAWHPPPCHETEQRSLGAAALEAAFLAIVGRGAWARA